MAPICLHYILLVPSFRPQTPTSKTPSPTQATPPPPPRCFLFSKPLHLPPLLLPASPRLASSSGDASAPILDLVERDWSFLDPDAADQRRAHNAHRAITAGEIRPESRVLAALPTVEFVNRIVESAPNTELLLAVHESLLVLALIKEGHDTVRCWRGEIAAVPEKFAPFDVVFVCFFPGMGVSLNELLSSVAPRCSPGARLVITFDQGREIIEQQYRQEYPDMITSDLPDRIALEKAATDYSFQITEFVDDSTVYLAVLHLC